MILGAARRNVEAAAKGREGGYRLEEAPIMIGDCITPRSNASRAYHRGRPIGGKEACQVELFIELPFKVSPPNCLEAMDIIL